MGGEQIHVETALVDQRGSSPRGRGTGERSLRAASRDRFIPAWAGNSRHDALAHRYRAVHPRVGGEQSASADVGHSLHGSSPRGRGTGSGPASRPPSRRFIPAWAGNRTLAKRHAATVPVHPRVGGEQVRPHVARNLLIGSSPRGRGTGISVRYRARVRRFIPAWAGNRRSMTAGCVPAPVHPRVGGEQSKYVDSRARHDGSSPRGRGTGSALV